MTTCPSFLAPSISFCARSGPLYKRMSSGLCARAAPAQIMAARPIVGRLTARTARKRMACDFSVMAVLTGSHRLDQGIGDAHATAAGADEHRIEIDGREGAIGRNHELGEKLATLDQRIDVPRRGAPKSLEKLRHLKAPERRGHILVSDRRQQHRGILEDLDHDAAGA